MPEPSQAQIISALTFDDGGRWTGPTITYSIPVAGSTWPDYPHYGSDWTEFYGNEPYKPEYAVLDSAQAATFRADIAVFQRVIGVQLVETDDLTNPGGIRVAITHTGFSGYTYEPPQPGASGVGMPGDIWINDQFVSTNLQLGWGAGETPVGVLLHELGHALGLKHPFEGATTLPTEYDSKVYSVMSYTLAPQIFSFAVFADSPTAAPTLHTYGPDVFANGPMVFDILALQSLYGANPTTALGNDVYRLDGPTGFLQPGSITSIYDAGGTDTIDASDQVRPSDIDLTPGAYSSIGIYPLEQQIAYWTAKFPQFADVITQELTKTANSGLLYTWHDNVGIAFGVTIENAIGGSGDDTVTGNVADNLIQGDAGDDLLFGGDGADTIQGGEGADQIDGGAGSNLLDGGAGPDTVSYDAAAGPVRADLGAGVAHTSSGTDTVSNFEGLIGSAYSDTLTGQASGANIVGGSGDDLITAVGGVGGFLRGGEGNDTIQGAAGFDDVNGNQGNDSIDGGAGGNDWLVGGQGDDVITSHASDDILYGNMGNDTLTGGTGDEIIRGGQGDDLMSAGAGNDWLSGDKGSDTITGGAGADTFHESAGGGLDRVLDFNAAEGDRVQLDHAQTYTVSQVGADTVVDLGDGDQMVLVGVNEASLPAGWLLQA